MGLSSNECLEEKMPFNDDKVSRACREMYVTQIGYDAKATIIINYNFSSILSISKSLFPLTLNRNILTISTSGGTIVEWFVSLIHNQGVTGSNPTLEHLKKHHISPLGTIDQLHNDLDGRQAN